mgnify:CR=1 FL=1
MENNADFANEAPLAAMLKVLADPKRLRILEMLVQGVHCNCEIAAHLGLSLSLISHHLRVLREAGLIHGSPAPADERWIYYTVDGESLAQLRAALMHRLDPARIQPRQPDCGPVPTAAECI